MVWSDEVGPVHLASGMPAKIVQGAQYMNDAMGSVYGKFTQAVNYEKSTEFRGGIWDCNPVKETVQTKSSYIENTKNSTTKTFSLEEMLACDDDVVTCNDTEMKEARDLVSNQNKAEDLSANASFTDMSIDVNNKRWRSEDFDKASLLPCNDSETTRKKPKKTVSFSDTVMDLENSFKKSSKRSKCFELDITAVKDDASSMKETERMKNSMLLVSENVKDVLTEMENKGSLPEKISESVKVKNWKKLMSQSCEINSCELQQPNEQMPVDVGSSKKLSHKKHRSRKAKVDNMAEHETVDNYKVKNEELMNRSHLEKSIPELFQFNETKTDDEAHLRSTKKNVKDESKRFTDELASIQNLAVKIKKTSLSFKKNSVVKGINSDINVDLPKNEVQSQTFKEDSDSKEIESSEDRLKNSLLAMFDDDSDIVESITIQLKKLAEQKKKIDVIEKDKIVLDKKQVDCVPMIRREKSPEEKPLKEQTCRVGKFLSEDESQYKSEKSVKQTEKVCCPPVCNKPSCNLQSFEKNGKMKRDLIKETAIEVNTNGTDNKSGKVSPTSYQDDKMFTDSVSNSRSDSCSNWRSQCIDVRSKDEENTTPQNWRKECYNLRSQLNKNIAGVQNLETRRVENWKKQQSYKVDGISKTEYVDDGMVVVPFYTKEPPSDPLSRFKDIKTDPESIWDACEEKTRPSRIRNQSQSQIEDFDQKNASEAEKVHAQLFRKIKATSIPRFFDSPLRTLIPAKQNNEICEEVKHPSPRKINISSSGMLNEHYRSRSQSRQGNFPHHRGSYERNRSSSAHWRSSLSSRSIEHDVYYIVKISSPKDDKIEKLKILKEDFLSEVRGNNKLSDLIPSPGYKAKKIPYSASAVTMFVRCIFSLSFKIPSLLTALEAFALAKKFGVEELKQACEDFISNYKIPSEQIEQVAAYAYQLHVVDALKSSKFFQKVQNFKTFSAQYFYNLQSTVSCSVLVDPSELIIPLLSEITRGLESCNVSDVRNRLFLTSLTCEICLTGIQLKFLTEDIHAELKVVCEVFQSKKMGNSSEKLFYKDLDTKAKSSIKISFDDEITVRKSEEIEIVVYIEDVLLKVCPQLTDDKLVSCGIYQARFDSSKTNGKNKLFCIEKLLYTTSQAW